MLVLSRKAGEKIQIGEGITVEVRRVAGNRVTLAIEAPKEVRILRGELEKLIAAACEPEPEPAPLAKPPEPRSDNRFQVRGQVRGRGLAIAPLRDRVRCLPIG